MESPGSGFWSLLRTEGGKGRRERGEGAGEKGSGPNHTPKCLHWSQQICKYPEVVFFFRNNSEFPASGWRGRTKELYRTVARDVFDTWFWNQSILTRSMNFKITFFAPLKGVWHEVFYLPIQSRPSISRLKYFQIRFRSRRDIWSWISKFWLLSVHDIAESNNLDWGTLTFYT